MSNFKKKLLLIPIYLLILMSNVCNAGKNINKLEQIFSNDIIESDVTYLEKFSGVARETNGEVKIYKVNGCEIEADVSGGKVQSLKMQLNKKCTFNLNNFIAYMSSSANTLTFGKFNLESQRESGRFYADCLEGCGNAYDPSVYQYYEDPRARALGSLEILLEGKLIEGDIIDASSKWVDSMKKEEGEQWIIDTKFNCKNKNEKKYNEIASKMFKNIKVSAITVGYNLAEKNIAGILKSCSTQENPSVAMQQIPINYIAPQISVASKIDIKQKEFTLTPDQLIEAEHSNKARFMRDIVGKTVKVTGRVKSISNGFFKFEAAGSVGGGWPVIINDNNYLANLDVGKVVTINCRIDDVLLFGGASKCD